VQNHDYNQIRCLASFLMQLTSYAVDELHGWRVSGAVPLHQDEDPMLLIGGDRPPRCCLAGDQAHLVCQQPDRLHAHFFALRSSSACTRRYPYVFLHAFIRCLDLDRVFTPSMPQLRLAR
jgi:hypothetical protein